MILTRDRRQRLCHARDRLRAANAPADVELAIEPNANPAAKTFQQARLKSRGVAFTRAPTAVGPVTIAVFADTCGNLIQIYEKTS